jgi:phage tail-like protein
MSYGESRRIHEKFKFIVRSLRFGFTAFQKCSELSVEVAKIDYFEGGALIPIKDPGRLTYSDVTLDRGVSSDFDFHNWFLNTADASRGPGGIGAISPQFKADDLSIVQRDRDNSRLREWNLVGSWPTKYTAGDWDNTADEVTIEQLVLTYDFFTVVA